MTDRRSDRGGEGRPAGGDGETATARRLATERAVLELSGELGYANVTVAALVEASGSNRSRFYSTFAGKAGCYAAAYEAAIESLAERVLGACATAESWPSGMRGALTELAEFIAAEPGLAKGLLAEVHVAGGAAAVKRKEVFERLSRAIDRARRETHPSRHSPPPVTSDFILSAIESAALRSLATGEAEQFALQVPGLLLLAIGSYFGHEAAWAEVRRLG
jgi:AcrR family transcriptional regulator